MPDAPDPVTSPPAQDFQPYDAAAEDGSSAGGWVKVKGGRVDLSTGQLTGDDFPSAGPWRQT
jgi:hypothetical protein